MAAHRSLMSGSRTGIFLGRMRHRSRGALGVCGHNDRDPGEQHGGRKGEDQSVGLANGFACHDDLLVDLRDLGKVKAKQSYNQARPDLPGQRAHKDRRRNIMES
jgi:hypothetical protein